MTHPRHATVDGHRIFYREAGRPGRPDVLLLHGFPTSSHQYRELIPLLADDFHVVAPDLPGFGFSDAPDRATFAYTFDHLAAVIDRFTEVVGLRRFAMYVFDYGAPVGWRIATAHPERISAIVSQNGNAYVEGLSDGWSPIRRYWNDRSVENRNALRDFLTPESIRWQYTFGAADADRVSPESYTLDSALLGRPGNDQIQLDLFGDYGSNVAQYDALHRYFAANRPPLLAAWGRNDPFFLPIGAEQFPRDNPNARVKFYDDAGHFALETHAADLGADVHAFLTQSIG